MDDDEIFENDITLNSNLTDEEKKVKMLKEILNAIFDESEISDELYGVIRCNYDDREWDDEMTKLCEIYKAASEIKRFRTCIYDNTKFRDTLINNLIDSKLFGDEEIFDNSLDQLIEEFPNEIKQKYSSHFLFEAAATFPELKPWIKKIVEACQNIPLFKNNQRKKALAAAFQKRQNVLKNFINGSFESEMVAEPQNNLTFHNPIICHIFENANAKVIEKLQKTCKLFYFKLPYAVFQNVILKTNDQIQFINRYSNFTMPGSELVENCKNLVITESIELDGNINFNIFVSKIYRCSISILSLSKIAITFDTYKILTGSGKIKKLIFDLVTVIDNDNQRVSLEDLLSYIPNAEEIDIHSCHVTPDTMLQLNSMPWKKKLSLFNLTFLDAQIDFDSYIEFIKKNLESNASFNLNFNPAQRDFEQRLENELLTWNPKPNFYGIVNNNSHDLPNPDYDNLCYDDEEEDEYGSDE